RHDALLLEGPEVRADAAQAGLHLVGNAHSTGGADVPIDRVEVVGRQHYLAADAGARLGNERRRAAPVTVQAVDDVAHRKGVLLTRPGVVALVGAPVHVRNGRGMHPGRGAAAAGASVLVGAEVDQRVGVAV